MIWFIQAGSIPSCRFSGEMLYLLNQHFFASKIPLTDRISPKAIPVYDISRTLIATNHESLSAISASPRSAALAALAIFRASFESAARTVKCPIFRPGLGSPLP